MRISVRNTSLDANASEVVIKEKLLYHASILIIAISPTNPNKQSMISPGLSLALKDNTIFTNYFLHKYLSHENNSHLASYFEEITKDCHIQLNISI